MATLAKQLEIDSNSSGGGMWEARDKRMDVFPLMNSPGLIIACCMGYWYFVKVWGPKFMEKREPFQLRGVLMVYNLCMILLNGWIFFEISRYGWLSGSYSYICQPVDYSTEEGPMHIAFVCYCFFVSKFIEWLDTIFFILRKKNNQVTVLHVLHHGILPISLWPGMRYTPGGQASFFVFVNTLVHVIMYFYYFVAALGPRYQKFIWWKKYLTSFQMAQFVAAALHCLQLVFIECDFPIALCWWMGCHEILFLFLFLNFYRQSYTKKDKIIDAGGEKQKLDALENNKKEF